MEIKNFNPPPTHPSVLQPTNQPSPYLPLRTSQSQPVPVATPGDGLELSKGGYSPITMNGKKVYAFATREVPTVLEEAMETASLKVRRAPTQAHAFDGLIMYT